MYTEEIHLPAARLLRFAAPVVILLILLAAVLTLLPLPIPARVAIGVVGGLYVVAAIIFVAMLSRFHIALDTDALTVGRRFLVARRYPLAQIAACAPTNAPVWGVVQSSRGLAYRPQAEGGCAVLLRLTDGARVTVPSGSPAALCAALRVRRPVIADAAADANSGRPSWNAPPGSWRAAAEAESRAGMIRCPRCGYTASAWDRGWTMWKAAGASRKYLRCPDCGRGGWHTVTRQPPPASPPAS
ncbi:MAG: hypothetical protein ACTHMJ_19970 [Thermomicrobiales bacterium]